MEIVGVIDGVTVDVLVTVGVMVGVMEIVGVIDGVGVGVGVLLPQVITTAGRVRYGLVKPVLSEQ